MPMRDTLLLDRRTYYVICLRPLKLVARYLRTCNAPNARSEDQLSSLAYAGFEVRGGWARRAQNLRHAY